MHNASQLDGGVYSYGYRTSQGSAFQLFTTTFSGAVIGQSAGSVSGWALNNAVPAIEKNTGNVAYVSHGGGTTVTLQPGQLWMHPGPAGQYADLRLTASTAGSYSFLGVFNAADSRPTTTDVHVLVNGVSVADGGINVNGGGSTASLASPGVSLNVGGTIDFIVGFGNGDYRYDSTGFTGNVTSLSVAVPEPSSWVLTFVGFVGVCYPIVKRCKV